METCIRFYARVTGWGILDWDVSSCRAFAFGILRVVTLPAHATSWSADNADVTDFIFMGERSTSRHFITYRQRIISGSFVQRPRSCLAIFIVFLLRLIFPFFISCSLRSSKRGHDDVSFESWNLLQVAVIFSWSALNEYFQTKKSQTFIILPWMSLSLNLHRDPEGEIYKRKGGRKSLCFHTVC
jgi:hypothetical protein